MLRPAVSTGLYLATMGDSRQDLKLGNINRHQGRNFQTKLPAMDDSSRSRRRRRGLKRQKRQNSIRVQSALGASISAASARTYHKLEQTLVGRIHKFTHRKQMIPMWKMLARFRTLTTFTPDQMRQFLYGVALTMHMFTRYNQRAVELQHQLTSVFLLVFVPFAIPPIVCLVIPLMIFLVPLLILVTAFTALNRRAAQVMERNRKAHRFERRTSVFTALGKSAVGAVTTAGGVVGSAAFTATSVVGGAAVLVGDGVGQAVGVVGEGVGQVAGVVGEGVGQVAGVMGDGMGQVAGQVAGGLNEGFRRTNSFMSNSGSQLRNLGSSISSIPRVVRRRKSTGGLKTNMGGLKRRMSSAKRRLSFRKQSKKEQAEEDQDSYLSSSAYGSTLTSSIHYENPNHRYTRHHNRSTLATSNSSNWEVEYVSSFESSDGSNESSRRLFRRATSIGSSSSRSGSTTSLVDSTPSTRHRRRREPWWRTSSNDTPTTNNTEPSASSLKPSSFASGGSSMKSSSQKNRNRALKRRVSFAAVDEVSVMERDSFGT